MSLLVAIMECLEVALKNKGKKVLNLEGFLQVKSCYIFSFFLYLVVYLVFLKIWIVQKWTLNKQSLVEKLPMYSRIQG